MRFEDYDYRDHKLFPQETAWVREYGLGYRLFAESQLQSGLLSLKHHDPAASLVAVRKVRDIPEVGDAKYSELQTITRAAQASSARSHTDTESQRLLDGLELHLAPEFDDLEERARRLIRGREAVVWAQALNTYANTDQFHAAGIAALELVEAKRTPEVVHEGLLTHHQLFYERIALVHLKRRRSELTPPLKSPETGAEYDGIEAELLMALQAIARHYLVRQRPPEDQARDELLRVTYEIDDLSTQHDALLRSCYVLLSAASRFGERRFFRQEAASFHKSENGALTRYDEDRPSLGKRPQPYT